MIAILTFNISEENIIESGYDPKGMTSSQQEDFRRLLEQFMEDNLNTFIGRAAEYAGLPEIVEFNDNDVYGIMFDYNYDDLRKHYKYTEDIDVSELYNSGQTTWVTGTGKYLFTIEINNVIKITMSDVNDPDKHIESYAYEDGNINAAIAMMVADLLQQWREEYNYG